MQSEGRADGNACSHRPTSHAQVQGPLLEVRALHKGYLSRGRRTPVLEGTDLTLRKGEVVALVGSSGAGKTTLLLVLARLLEADSGEAVFGGTVLPLRETCRGRERMSLVFQDPYSALAPYLTVRRIVAEPLRIRKRGAADEALICRALSTVHLAPPEVFLDRYPAQLSGGQRQRVAMARALVTGPELLLADEPTSMLDASAGVGILNLFRELSLEGMTILLSIHDLATACYVADRILVLSDGAVVEEGRPSELIVNARHDLTQRLIAAARMRSVPPHELSGGAGLDPASPTGSRR